MPGIKMIFAAALLLICTAFVYSQTKPAIAVLPFAGGQGNDGESLAEQFSYQDSLKAEFNVIPRTSINQALLKEQNFQLKSGMTNSDTIVSIGKQIGAQYIVAGSITSLGKQKLLIISIIKIDDIRLIAGDIQTYNTTRDIQSKLPHMTATVVSAAHNIDMNLTKLAVLPFQLSENVSGNEADVLAQILAIILVMNRKYAVYPRTATLEQVQAEYRFQLSGITADKNIIDIGRAVNPQYVLSGVTRRSYDGTMNVINASIIDLNSGEQVGGDSMNYNSLNDGINQMEYLALRLTDLKAAAKWEMFSDPKKFWSIGASVGSTFSAPWLLGSIHGTIAPFRYSFFEIGLDYGMISGNADAKKYFTFYPFIHYAFFLPFRNNGGWYAGAGFGYMTGEYTFPEEKIPVNIFAFDAATGFNIFNMLNISYVLRINPKLVDKKVTANNKLTIGYTYRFGQGRK